MSNYIRTEEGHIYEYVEQRIYPNQYAKFGLYRHNLNSEYEQIIAQSDNLAELIDEVIIVDKLNYHYKVANFVSDSLKYVTSKRQFLNDYAFSFIEDDEFVYGAIWTDKGLIYVAELNEDGKLELI